MSSRQKWQKNNIINDNARRATMSTTKRINLYFLLTLVMSLALGFLIAGVLSAPVEAQVTEQGMAVPTCRWEAFEPAPGRTVSASWDLENENLLVVDNLFDEVVGYDATGRRRAGLPISTKAELEGLHPYRVLRGPKSLWFVLGGARLVSVGDGVGFDRYVDLQSEAIQDGWGVSSVLQAVVAGGDLVSFGDLQDLHPDPSARMENTWKQAFLRVPIATPDQYKVLWQEQPPFDRNRRNFYKLAQPRIAALGSTAYVLMMNEEVEILESRKGSGDLVPTGIRLPEELKKRPNITYALNDTNLVDAYSDMEKSTMIDSIYGWHDHLYLLARKPGREGTIWSLLQLDPKKGPDAITATAILQTHANHLTVVPGNQWWAFVEKGPQEQFNRQEVRGVHLVPANLIQHLESGMLCQAR